MKIAVIGLGLIGGSIAKAIKEQTDHTVLGADIVQSVLLRAKLTEAIDDELTEANLPECETVIIALYPEAAVRWLRENARRIAKHALVVDCCGVKKYVCDRVKDLAEEHGFVFIGGHPMAGRERSGFDFSTSEMFKKASMILTPYADTDIREIERAKKLFLSIGFGRVKFSTPQEHDEMIAFTSQLAHIVSGAYVKTPLAMKHKGFSAGSFKDMTRVARLNEQMWTELFLENQDLLLTQVEALVDRMCEYRDALREKDTQKLKAILREGREIKESLED